METKILLAITLLILTIFTTGCIQDSSDFACNEPYIQIGSECCLDANDNGICDSDEQPAQEEAPEEEAVVEEDAMKEADESTPEASGDWCVETDHNELTDPVMFINRQFLMSADHYFVDKYTLNIEKVLSGSDVLTAYGLRVPIVEYEYQAYDINNVKVEARLNGKERDIDYGTVFQKNSVKTATWHEGANKDEDVYFMLKLEEVQEGDVVELKIDYDVGNAHYTICEDMDDLVVVDQEPEIELHRNTGAPFEKKGKFMYVAEYSFGSSTSTVAHNIFEQSGDLAGEPGAYIFYQKDMIPKTMGAYTYDLEVEKKELTCTDPADCAFELKFNRGNCTGVMKNLCTRDSYLAFVVYDLTTEEFADYLVELSKDDELYAICHDPC